MWIKGLEIEDFVNYKKPCMFISMGTCDWKCCIEQGLDISICQNSKLAKAQEYNISLDKLYKYYITNPITEAIVIGGLEPFTRYQDIYDFVKFFRDNKCNDDIIIYTGYMPEEFSSDLLSSITNQGNIIIKFGRYIPNRPNIYDEVLGVTLASDNQFAIEYR